MFLFSLQQLSSWMYSTAGSFLSCEARYHNLSVIDLHQGSAFYYDEALVIVLWGFMSRSIGKDNTCLVDHFCWSLHLFCPSLERVMFQQQWSTSNYCDQNRFKTGITVDWCPISAGTSMDIGLWSCALLFPKAAKIPLPAYGLKRTAATLKRLIWKNYGGHSTAKVAEEGFRPVCSLQLVQRKKEIKQCPPKEHNKNSRAEAWNFDSWVFWDWIGFETT